MKRRQSNRAAWGIAFLAFANACSGVPGKPSRLPEYAQPSVEVMQPGEYKPTDTIPYRQLTRGDFHGTSPPKEIGTHGFRVGAYTCAAIIPNAVDVKLAIDRDPGNGDYVARFPPLRFHAKMDRECSWWNPDETGLSTRYTLQHEQIHFAIFEIEARSLQGEVNALRGRGRSPRAAATALQRAHDAAVHAATKRVLERSTRFDEETSGVPDETAQSRWAERIQGELEPGS